MKEIKEMTNEELAEELNKTFNNFKRDCSVDEHYIKFAEVINIELPREKMAISEELAVKKYLATLEKVYGLWAELVLRVPEITVKGDELFDDEVYEVRTSFKSLLAAYKRHTGV